MSRSSSGFVFYGGVFLLTAFLGAWSRSKRVAALSGALLGFGLPVSIAAGDWAGASTDWGGVALLLLFFTILGALIALIASWFASVLNLETRRSQNSGDESMKREGKHGVSSEATLVRP